MTEEEKKQQQQQQAAAQQPIQPIQPIDPAPAPPQQQEAPQQESYTSELDKLLQTYDRRKTDDDRANRRSRVSEAIAGIGDVARAVSNLYHTTQYAPYVPSDNISDTLRTRNDRLTALRDKNRDQWMHYVLNVAGKKEQSRQAAERNRLTKEHYDRQAKLAADKAAKKQTEDEAKDYAATYAAAMLTGVPAEVEAKAIAELNKQKAAGQLGDNDYEARKKALGRERSRAELTQAKNQTSQDNAVQRSTRIANTKGSGRGSSRDPYIYIPYGDGSGAKINKNDAKAISAAYGMLPDDAKNPYVDKPSDYEGKVRDYLNRHPNTPQAERIKEHFKQVEKRQQTQPSQQPKPKGNGSLLPNQPKTTGSLLPQK